MGKNNSFPFYGLVNYRLNYTNFHFGGQKLWLSNSTWFRAIYLIYLHMNVHIYMLNLTNEALVIS